MKRFLLLPALLAMFQLQAQQGTLAIHAATPSYGVQIGGERYGSQYADNGYCNDQFDEGESVRTDGH